MRRLSASFLALIGATFREALRSASPFVSFGLSAVATWGALSLDVLALETSQARGAALVVATGELISCLGAAILAASFVARDRESDLYFASSALRAGAQQHWTARILSASAIGVATGVGGSLIGIVFSVYSTSIHGHHVYCASICSLPAVAVAASTVAAWAGLSAHLFGAWPGVLVGGAAVAIPRLVESPAASAWLPLPVSLEGGGVEVARALLLLAGPVLLGLAATRPTAAVR